MTHPNWVERDVCRRGTLMLGQREYHYTLLRDDYCPWSRYFAGYPGGHLFASVRLADDTVHPTWLRAVLTHEILCLDPGIGKKTGPQRCIEAFEQELLLVPPFELSDYLAMRRPFLAGILDPPFGDEAFRRQVSGLVAAIDVIQRRLNKISAGDRYLNAIMGKR